MRTDRLIELLAHDAGPAPRALAARRLSAVALVGLPVSTVLALAAAGCGPDECVYADDRPELVAAASALGIPGFVVDGPESLRRGLARYELLVPPTTVSGNSPAATDVPRR